WHAASDLPQPDPLQVAGLALPSRGRRAARLVLRRSTRWLGAALREGPLVDPQGTKLRGPLLLQAAVADGSRVMLPRLLRYAVRKRSWRQDGSRPRRLGVSSRSRRSSPSTDSPPR